MPRKLTPEDFIARCKKIHGDLYDYSETKYTSYRNEVCVICKIHGRFFQRAGGHCSGQKCPKCHFDSLRNSVEEFILNSKKIHGEKYDYSRVKYVNNCSDITIRCPKHGNFNQRPSHHMDGRGCPTCAVVDQRHDTSEFIMKSLETHGDLYDYSRSIYRTWKSRVEIICKKHGPFNQIAGEHVSGAGCPKCGKSRISRLETEFLDHVGIKKEFRQYRIPTTRFQVDGFDSSNSMIYEFLGDYWHGNPKIYARSTNILNSKLTCGVAYDRTFERFDKLKRMGYIVRFIWESDWKCWSKQKIGEIPIVEYNM